MTARGWLREVVAKRAAVVAAVTAVAHLVVVLGLPASLETSVPAVVGAAIDLVGMVAAVLWVRAGVTPADPALAPRAADGTPLKPAGSAPLSPGARNTGRIVDFGEDT